MGYTDEQMNGVGFKGCTKPTMGGMRMYNFGVYAENEITPRIVGRTGYRGFSGADADSMRATQRLCKARTGTETARDISAISALNRAAGVFY